MLLILILLGVQQTVLLLVLVLLLQIILMFLFGLVMVHLKALQQDFNLTLYYIKSGALLMIGMLLIVLEEQLRLNMLIRLLLKLLIVAH